MDRFDNLPSYKLMEIGKAYEAEGKNLEAAQAFYEVAQRGTIVSEAAVFATAAINFRLAGPGSWKQAHDIFSQVITQTGDASLRDRTLRDRGMLHLDEGNYALAHRDLVDALESQNRRNETVEYWVTYGFIGRLQLLQGGRSAALQTMLSADRGLVGKNDVYELNNLVWLMKAQGLFARVSSLGRVAGLVSKTGYRRRVIEAVLIAISPPLYSKLRRLKAR